MRVAFRVDSAPWIGTGHVMRCLSLAIAMRERGWEVCFVSRHIPATLVDRVGSHGVAFAPLPPYEDESAGTIGYAGWLRTPIKRDAEDTLELLSSRAWDWLVVDHYALDDVWEQRVRNGANVRVLAIDDLANRPHAASVLIDQNLFVDSAERYRKLLRKGTVELLGPRFALLNPEFARLRATTFPRDGSVNNIMVMFGGADETNATADAVEALGRMEGAWRVVVVVGAAYAHLDSLRMRCDELGFELYHDSPIVAELLRQADFSIGAAGSTSWERCCLGVPAVTVPCAENQHPIAAGLSWAGAAVVSSRKELRAHDRFASSLERLFGNEAELRSLSLRAHALVDGHGTSRVLHAIEAIA